MQAGQSSIRISNWIWYVWVEDIPIAGDLVFLLGGLYEQPEEAFAMLQVLLDASNTPDSNLTANAKWMVSLKQNALGELVNMWKVKANSYTSNCKRFPRNFKRIKSPSKHLLMYGAQLSLEVKQAKHVNQESLDLVHRFKTEMARYKQCKMHLPHFETISVCSLGELNCVAVKTRTNRQEIADYYYIEIPKLDSTHDLLGYLSTI